MPRPLAHIILAVTLAFTSIIPAHARQSNDVEAVTYYVSASSGNDGNAGTSEAVSFKTLGKVNALALQPGDRVLFKCGDVWQGEALTVTRSGASGNPITFGSYPDAACADKPVISGSRPIAGWVVYAGNIYAADLNAASFPNGLNQLFKDGQRLQFGRWPNINAPDGGYARIDGQPADAQITDAQLPAKDWTGAHAHIKGMRWYIINRKVTASSGATLTLNDEADCWPQWQPRQCGADGGWGYWLDNDLDALDQDGEWYYDAAARRVYVVSAGGAPTNIEGSVVLKTDDRAWGLITLGADLGARVQHVVVDNLDVRNSWRHGIASPTNLANRENTDIVIRNNRISDAYSVGINLATWVFDAQDGGVDGWRGGDALQVLNNTIDGANEKGIYTYSRNSSFVDNTISNIALIKNLGADGMGCGFTGESCTERGQGVDVDVDKRADSGRNNTLQYNRLTDIGGVGIFVVGGENKINNNVITRACISKGDCAGIYTFGYGGSLNDTSVTNTQINGNIIVDVMGNTDGTANTYRPLFGMGITLDHFSANTQVGGNTVIRATLHGILFQDSTGVATDNTLFRNSSGTMYAQQIAIGANPAQVATLTGNIMLGASPNVGTLKTEDAARVGMSNSNRFLHTGRASHIWSQGDKTLAQWRSYSGKDAASTDMISATLALAEIVYNDTKAAKAIPLSKAYRDLDGNVVSGNLTLPPFASRILLPAELPPPRAFLPITPR
jgi:hypothetical protein